MKYFILLLFLLVPFLLDAQIWSENFDGSNTTNTPTFPAACAADDDDYIGIVCSNSGTCANPIGAEFLFTGDDGAFFGVRDMGNAPCMGNLAGETLRFSAIDISSCGGSSSVLYVCFTAAESQNQGGVGNPEWSNSGGREDTWDANSFLFVQSRIDGGAFSDVTAIQANANVDTRPGIDINCDGDANDAGEPALSDAFTNYCFELPSFGASLDLNFTFGELNTSGEDLALDDIEVYCSDASGTSLPGTVLAACTPFVNNACLFVEDFDGSNTTNPLTVGCGIANSTDYFGIVCANGGPCGGSNDVDSDYVYTNADGSFFGARDIDNAAVCGTTVFGTLSASGINISGATQPLYVCMSFAETNNATENSSDGSFDSWDADSEVSIFTTIDGTEYFLTSLRRTAAGNTPPGFDTNCSGGNADQDVLTTNEFTTFCFALASGGNLLDLSIEVANLNTDGEDIAIDNISVCATNNTANLPGQVITSCNIDRPLPVTLTNFRGEMLPKGAFMIKWETATETENDYFDLEYSTNGETFTFLTRVEGKGNTTWATRYAFEHTNPQAEINYYRLKQVDFDGTATYSNVIVLRREAIAGESLVYPNPARDVIVYVGTEATLTVFDAYGKMVMQLQTTVATQTIDVRDLASGTYIMQIVSNDDVREVKRFVKVN